MKKFASVLFGALIALSAAMLGGCGGKRSIANTETDLQIFYWNSGQGSAWLDKTIAAFEDKYPEVNVQKDFREDNSTWETELVNDTVNTVDLYISTMTNFLAYTDYIEPLDEVLGVKWEGEDVTLASKANQDMLDTLRGEDGKLYASLWGGGVCGLVYNKTVFEDQGYKVPRTTEELALLAGEMKDDGYIPFIHCSNADYWMYCLMPWAAQYDGVQTVYDFWTATYRDADGTVHQPDIRAMKTEGRKVALEEMEQCVSPKGYTYSASNSTNHTDAQTLFLAGRALMMPNGSWMENEMSATNSKIEYAFMKAPVVSQLGEKLGISDRALCDIIDYVDGVKTQKPTFTTASGMTEDEIIERVAAARSVVYSEAVSNRCLIPNYSNAKEWAKKFVQFMNSDEALKIYINDLHQVTTVVPADISGIDTSSWSVFMQSASEIADGASLVFRSKGYKLFYNSSAIMEFYPDFAQTSLTATDEKDKLSVNGGNGLWAKYVKYYDDNWETALEQAGLK